MEKEHNSLPPKDLPPMPKLELAMCKLHQDDNYVYYNIM